MARASWECPITGEQCSAPNCKRNYCGNAKAKAAEAAAELRITEDEQIAKFVASLTDEQVQWVIKRMREGRKKKRQP